MNIGDFLTGILDFVVKTLKESWEALSYEMQALVLLIFALLLLYLILHWVLKKPPPPPCPYCSDNYEIFCKRPQVNDTVYRRANVCPICGKKLPYPPDNRDV